MNELKDVRRRIWGIVAESENVPIMAEDIIDVTNPPKYVLEAKVDECDAYIGIFDKRWGFVPRRDNSEQLSVTAIEYERARTNGIPRLIMLSTGQKESDLQEFTNKISGYENGDWIKKYNGFEELFRLVTRGIPRLVEAVQSLKKVDDDDNPFLMEPLRVIVSPSLANYGDELKDISQEEVE